jgi:predicted dehydrogenase
MALKTAVIGVGSLGQHHARILSSLENSELVAVVDKNGERAKEIASKYNTSFLSDYKDLKEVDAVVVSVPTSLHLEVSKYFLEKGVSVLCEKPMAASLEECDEILQSWSKGGGKLLIGHIEHFNPAVESVLNSVSTPGFLEVHRLGVFTGRSLDVDVVYDLMIHDIEIALSLLKKEIEDIDAIGVNVLSEHIDIANARLSFKGGCVANLTSSRISREKVRKLRIFEKNSYFSVDYGEQSIESYRVEDSQDGKKEIKKIEFNIEKKEPLRIELEHFLKIVEGKESPKVGGEMGRESVRIASIIVDKIHKRWLMQN